MFSMTKVLASLACFALSCESAMIKEGTSTAISVLMNDKKGPKVDTKTIVASLGEVSKGLGAEDDKALKMAQNTKSTCKDKDRKLNMALDKGKRSFDMATDDYTKTKAQVDALQASLAELQGQVSSSSGELDMLQAKLKQMRIDKGLIKKGAGKVLRQVEAVIAKTYLRESNDEHKGPTALDKKVSSLERLSRSLSFLQTDSGLDEDHAEEQQEDSSDKTHAPVLILKADKQAVVRASDATQRGFDEEEKKVMDLIEVERKKLSDLEDNLQDLQPAISNKLKQAMEINRTLDAAEQGMDRDTSLLAIETSKCKAIGEGLAAQKKQRAKVMNDVKMAAQILKHMDTALFLTQDLQGLTRTDASFLQVESSSRHASRDVEDTPESTGALSLLQETDGLEELVDSYGSSSITSEGPFDGVTKMIGGLIASLKAQANEEVNQNQFCQDSLAKNRRDRVAKKNGIDTLASTIRWSKMAIVRLGDDTKYLEEEKIRLKTMIKKEDGEQTAEEKRVGKEFAEHKLANEVVKKIVVILDSLCSLGGGASSFLQNQGQHQNSKVGSRFSQCKEASDLLKSGSKAIDGLDSMTKDYLKKYVELSDKIMADALSAHDSRDSELKSVTAAKAERASELATATKDVKEAQKELSLIAEAEKNLQHRCSHVETREEKMARRKEQIDALTEALKVLEGEAIPA